jgi:hypothetical protein
MNHIALLVDFLKHKIFIPVKLGLDINEINPLEWG